MTEQKDISSAMNILQTISNSLNQKYIEQFTIITNKSKYELRLEQPINLDQNKNYNVSLIFFTVYNTIKNITSENNSFHYKKKDEEWKTVELSEGSYEIDNLNMEIQKLTGLDESEFRFGAVQYLNRAELKIEKDSGLNIKFDDNSFGYILGFNNETYKETTIAQNRPDISKISTINIKTNLIDGGYINDKRNNILHTIPTFTVPVGYKIIEKPSFPIKTPLSKKNIDVITIEIVDEDGNYIDFSGEEITIKLLIEQL